MSMFHELMMRKKGQIMYATIKGTLTENDGVFSGFSGTNYLELQNNIDTTQDYEIVVKFVNSTSKYHSVILGSNSTANSIKIEISYGTRFFIFLSSNGTSWNIANGAYGLANAMSLGNTYYMKLTYSSVNGYKLFLSTDKINWSLQWSNGTTNALYMTNAKFILGASLFDNNSLGGSIDLNNNSYIKLGSTKYNLQAVVGYTIVGSPTITDGVVSGFSSANYLTLTLDKNVSNITEYVFKFKLTSEGLRNQYNYLFRRGNFQFSIYGTTTNFSIPTMYLPTYNQNVSLTGFVPVVDNWYWVKYTYDGTTVKLYSSTDGITWTIRNTVTNVTVAGSSGTFYLGFADTNVNSYFGGEIDLNETYIKVNGKLWFNGQQA